MQAKITKKVSQVKGAPKVTELMKLAQKAHQKLQNKSTAEVPD